MHVLQYLLLRRALELDVSRTALKVSPVGLENQMAKKMDKEMETGRIKSLTGFAP